MGNQQPESNAISGRIATTLQDPLSRMIREAVLAAYQHEFNAGKTPDLFLIEAIVLNVGATIDSVTEQDANDPRQLAYDAIDTERTYQDAGFGNASASRTQEIPGRPMSLGECGFTLEELLVDLRRVWYRPESTVQAMHIMRKIGGVAVQALEHYGAPKRDFSPQQRQALEAHSATESLLDALFRREQPKHPAVTNTGHANEQDVYPSPKQAV